MAFLPGGRFAYVVNELNSTITSFAYDAQGGALTAVETATALPGYYDGPNAAAEIAVHPSGKSIYVSNRGYNSVVLFSVDPDRGALTYIEEQGTGGKTLRYFGIQPSAKHMAIANQDSGTLLACRIDSGNRRLKRSGVFAEAPTPMCAKFLPPSKLCAESRRTNPRLLQGGGPERPASRSPVLVSGGHTGKGLARAGVIAAGGAAMAFASPISTSL
jgi:6-phosphogluconolactonase